jgi:hypothetical protein
VCCKVQKLARGLVGYVENRWDVLKNRWAVKNRWGLLYSYSDILPDRFASNYSGLESKIMLKWIT